MQKQPVLLNLQPLSCTCITQHCWVSPHQSATDNPQTPPSEPAHHCQHRAPPLWDMAGTTLWPEAAFSINHNKISSDKVWLHVGYGSPYVYYHLPANTCQEQTGTRVRLLGDSAVYLLGLALHISPDMGLIPLYEQRMEASFCGGQIFPQTKPLIVILVCYLCPIVHYVTDHMLVLQNLSSTGSNLHSLVTGSRARHTANF